MTFKLCNNGNSVVGVREDGAIISYSINAEEYKQWLAEGNTPEPEFTDEELQITSINKQIQEAKIYLASTAWYVERLNDPSSGKVIPEEVLTKRAEAREVINTLEAELVTIGAK